MRLHILHCGSIRVDPSVPFGDRLHLADSARQVLAPDRDRVELPVSCYLIEHPRGKILVDTGWCRDISPDGVRDRKAAARVLPGYLEAYYRPALPAGQAVHEQLAAMGIQPADLTAVLLTHLDPDHVAGLRHVQGAKRIVLPEDEYFWACRAVYKARQPWSLWMDYKPERLYYRGSAVGPNRWAIDLFGDESLLLVNVPGHTDGQAAVLIRSGRRFAVLAAVAAYCPRNWREDIVPGSSFDPVLARKGLAWLREMEADPACAGIFCSHDPDVAPGVVEI